MLGRDRYDFGLRGFRGAFRGWGFQDFTAALGNQIGSTSVTLSDNTNGTDVNVFESASVISNTAVICVLTGGAPTAKKPRTQTGAAGLFTKAVTVSAHTGASVTLSGVPHSSFDCRIYYFYNYQWGAPLDYSIPSKAVASSLFAELQDLLVTEEEIGDGSKDAVFKTLKNTPIGGTLPAAGAFTSVWAGSIKITGSTISGCDIIIDADDNLHLSSGDGASVWIGEGADYLSVKAKEIKQIEKLSFGTGGLCYIDFPGSDDLTVHASNELVLEGSTIKLKGTIRPYDHIYPKTNDIYNLGMLDYGWHNIYLDGEILPATTVEGDYSVGGVPVTYGSLLNVVNWVDQNLTETASPTFAGLTVLGTATINTATIDTTTVSALTADKITVGTEEGTHLIYFYEDDSPTGEYLAWVDSSDTFSFSDDLQVLGNIKTTYNLTDGTNSLTIANAKDAYDKRVTTWTAPLALSAGTASISYSGEFALRPPANTVLWLVQAQIDHGSIGGLDDNDHGAIYYTETEVDTFISNLVDGTTAFTGIDVNGGTVDAITALTVANNVDIGNFTLTAADFIDSSLVGYWQFGSVNDSSPKGNDGTLTGAGAITGGYFEGIGATNCGMSVSTSNMSVTTGTMMCWANTDTIAAGTDFAMGHTNGSIATHMFRDAASFNIRLGTSDAVDTGDDFVVGTWYHIALTWNDGTYHAYWNGEETATGSYTGLTSLAGTMDIGDYGGTSGPLSWDGKIDEVRAYNRDLAAYEIRRIYNDSAHIYTAIL